MSKPERLTHERAFELLPWLVNGTLEGVERAAVDEHARTCIACRREIKEQQRLLVIMSARGAADVSVDAGFEQLDAAAKNQWRRMRTATPFAIAAAAGLAVLAVLFWFTPLPAIGPGAYSTLATPPSSSAPLFDVVFEEDTTAAEMRQLLADIGGEIVAGPSDLGRYSVRIPEVASDDGQVGDALRALRDHPRVRFAGRAFAEIEP